MTKKHFIKIASVLNKALKLSNDKIEAFNFIINELCVYFKSENINFDKDKFINAILK